MEPQAGRAKALLMPGAVGVLALLLVALATLQYRWLEQVSVAERSRLRSGARRHAQDFARDFDRQLAQAWAWLLVTSDTLHDRNFERYAQRREQWRSLARHPELVKDVYLVERGDAGPQLKRFDAERRDFVAEPWPASFAAMRERLTPLLANKDQETPLLRGPPDPVDEAAMAFVVPIPEPRPPAPPGPPEPAPRRERRRPLAAFEVIAFDAAAIREQVLPAMIQRHFEDHDSVFSIGVFQASSGRRLAGDRSMTRQEPVEASFGLFALRFEQAGGDLELASGRPAAEQARRPPPRRPDFVDEGGRWRAVVRHREGPIDAVVARVQRRNLAIGFSVIGLLGASAVLLVVSAQRSRRLAEQQLAFVASVSHELRTPVTVIAQSARNLADGIVKEPEQVKRYGGVIHKEARRLAETVSQVLEFAAPPAPLREAVDLLALAQDAIQALEPEAQAAGSRVTLRAESGAGVVVGDAPSLRRALLNLLSNAIKYGRGGDVEVGLSREGDAVALVVSDQGLGIPESERERVFEPFYRGREALAGQISGNGLGLSLVRRIAQAHGGALELHSVHGKGSRFTLRLRAPAAAPAPRVPQAEPSVPETHPSR